MSIDANHVTMNCIKMVTTLMVLFQRVARTKKHYKNERYPVTYKKTHKHTMQNLQRKITWQVEWVPHPPKMQPPLLNMKKKPSSFLFKLKCSKDSFMYFFLQYSGLLPIVDRGEDMGACHDNYLTLRNLRDRFIN